MQYHSPDLTWTIFSGVTDYESYVERFVIKGHFHALVPQDVKTGYTIAENIMAHAWYHYPMMDEALVKLLRVLEMAVKMRCEETGIPVKNEKERPKNLKSLLEQLLKAEPSKPIGNMMHGLRTLRNAFMHPNENMLLGAMATNTIRQTLVQLNALFLPEVFFEDAKNILAETQKHWQPFALGPLILNHLEKTYLVYESQVVEAYQTKTGWDYFCAFYIVFNDVRENLNEFRFPEPILLVLSDLEIKSTMFSAINRLDAAPITIFKTDHLETLTVYEAFQSALKSVNPDALRVLETSLHSQVEKCKMKCRSEYWVRNH